MKVDPDKCDLMHFTWRKGSETLGIDSNPPLVTDLYGERIILTAPASIRWLGFHLDRKLSFRHHVTTVAKKGTAIVHGLQVLGNTISGIGPANLRLLYKTVVLPAITYGTPLWFNPARPNTKLVKELEKVQWKALIQIAGGFFDSQTEALQMLTYIPPMTTTLTKLYKSATPRFPRLPLYSKITRRLPADFLRSFPTLQWLVPEYHVPFSRPQGKSVNPKALSPLMRMCTVIDKNMERGDPFHSQNAPHSLKLSSLPFAGRLFINPEACPRKKHKSLTSKQRLWLNTKEGRCTLCVFTDGSKTVNGVGWAVTGIHAGITLFKEKVPFVELGKFDPPLWHAPYGCIM